MSENFSITFETKCYENDWEFILTGHYLEKMIERCGINFTHKQLIINNVKNRNLVESYVLKKMQLGVIDSYHFTEDTEKEVLDFFHTPKESFGKGFVYSISELTGIYFCKTDYLLHFSSDAFLCRSARRSNWISESIALFEKNSDYVISNPAWNNLYYEAKEESISKTKNFYISQGFSDQCYLIKTDVFKNSIYNEKNIISERYPAYGGELFEKRCDSFLRNNSKYRLVNYKTSYIHANFPKSGFNRFLTLFFIKYNIFPFCCIGRNPNKFSIFHSEINKKFRKIIKRIIKGRN